MPRLPPLPDLDWPIARTAPRRSRATWRRLLLRRRPLGKARRLPRRLRPARGLERPRTLHHRRTRLRHRPQPARHLGPLATAPPLARQRRLDYLSFEGALIGRTTPPASTPRGPNSRDLVRSSSSLTGPAAPAASSASTCPTASRSPSSSTTSPPPSRRRDASVDAWFLDGFAPSKNPAMWSAETLAHVARLSAPNARAATYTVAGDVRRNLEAAGFAVAKMPGHGRKKETPRSAPDRRPDPPNHQRHTRRHRRRRHRRRLRGPRLPRRGCDVTVYRQAPAPRRGRQRQPARPRHAAPRRGRRSRRPRR